MEKKPSRTVQRSHIHSHLHDLQHWHVFVRGSASSVDLSTRAKHRALRVQLQDTDMLRVVLSAVLDTLPLLVPRMCLYKDPQDKDVS